MLTFSPGQLVDLSRDVFQATGTPADIADLVARSLVDSNLAGHDSHGVIRVPWYVEGIKRGMVVADARPRVVKRGRSTALVDGAWGFGQVGARFATELAAELAREADLGLVSVIRSNHIGRLGEWTELLAGSGLIGMVTTAWGSGPYWGAPYGGAARALGTNPIAWGMPLGECRPPLISDYATTAAAEGKMRVARAKQAPLPPGLILDSQGRPSTDAEDFYNGGMFLPFGGHKGYGLGLVVELLSVALSGADVATDQSGRANGSTFLAIDPTAFRPLVEFETSARKLMDRVKAVPPAPGFDEVLVPGEPEHRSRTERERNGIAVPEATWEALQTTARDLGVAVSA
jgi:LDH2 family malate/lactate/ureidoglycolate dehydrogenase